MSISSFNSKLEKIEIQSTGFEFQTQVVGASILGKQVQIQQIESSHQQIFEVYEKLHREIDQLKQSIHEQTTYSNQEDMFLAASNVTELETKIDKIMIQFNDCLLTHFPTAHINYGRPCIGPKVAPVLETKNMPLKMLLNKSACMREIRGDGNCFVSAFTTRFLETLVKDKAIAHFIEFLTKDGIDEPLLKESLISTLLYLTEYPSQLETILQDNQKLLPFINYFRAIAAHEMKTNPDDYAAFFVSDVSDVFKANTQNKKYETLVEEYVKRMGIDFSHPAITALCRKMQFSVVILDAKIGANDGVNVVESLKPSATFCRNGEHYFLLYTKEESAPILPQSNIPGASFPQSPPQKPTDIIVKCNLPFGSNLFIRGSGSGLNWEKGIPLIQIDESTWIFQSSSPLEDIEYKFLINDEIWENTDNHRISQGKLDPKPPQFSPSALQTNTEIVVPTTKITVKYNAGFGNKLTIQGTGPGLQWGKGVEMKNIGADLWIWETQSNFENFEFKILLNDTQYQTGMNNKIEQGKKAQVVPSFS